MKGDMTQLFGAGDHRALKNEVSTSLITGIIFTVFLSIVCMVLSKWILVVTSTPKDILNDADKYLKIIFAGLIFSLLYNFYSSALRAIGDSRTPFIFLIVSSIINGVLGVIFIVVFKLGGSRFSHSYSHCSRNIPPSLYCLCIYKNSSH